MINLKLATDTWDLNEKAAILNVLDSGFLTMGEKVEKFEKDFAEYFNTKYAIMVNSGSSANLLSIAALFYRKENKLKQGDEVIVPAVSWSTTFHPLYQHGLKLKFVDIDLNTLNYDLQALESAISDQTRLIVSVNLLGNSNDFTRINELISDKNIILIEDNCEAMGATYNDKYTGTFGLMGTFSSYFSHHISTIEGGIIITDNEELYHILLSLRSHGWTRHLPVINHVTGIKSSNVFEESFKFVLPGYNLRPIEFQGALGIEQLKKLPRLLQIRRKNAEKHIEFALDNNRIIAQSEIGNSSWFGFSVIMKDYWNISRKELVEQLTELGVETRPIVSGNFTKNPVMKYYNYTIHNKLKNADKVHNRGFFIGNHHYDIEEKLFMLHKLFKEL